MGYPKEDYPSANRRSSPMSASTSAEPRVSDLGIAILYTVMRRMAGLGE